MFIKMKKLILFSLLIYLFTSDFLLSQTGWYWQNPLPQGNDLLSISFLNQNTGYAVGNFGAMIKTTDKGESWRFIELVDSINYYQIKFLNSNTGYLRTNDNKILKSTDGGLNWSIICSSTNNISYMSFYDPNIGAFISNQTVYKTTNGGINWFSYYTYDTYKNLYYIQFLNDSCVYLSGSIYTQIYPNVWVNKGIIYTTGNNGINWSSNIFNNTSKINSIYFLSSSTGYVTGNNSFFARSTNGGNSWQQIIVDSIPFDLWDIHFINGQTGFVLPKYKTTNGGLNWYPTILENMYDIDTPDINTFISIGKNGVIYKSTDSGNEFIKKSKSVTSSRLNTIYCVSDSIYYAGGNSGVIIKTTNGGKDWFNQQSGVSNFICSIKFLNISTGFAVTPLYVLNTSNGGNNWNILYSSSGYNEDIMFLDENMGFVAGRNGLFMKTNNGGNNWSYITLNNSLTYTSICFINQQTGFVLGLDWSASNVPTVFKTTNGGINWTSYNGPTYGNDIYFINESTGITVGRSGEIYRSTNGGTIWNKCTSPTNYDLKSVAFINEKTGYISGMGNIGLLKTTNSGLSWILEFANLGSEDMNMWNISSYNGVAVFVGDYGLIKSTRQEGGIIVKKINSNIPSSFSLSQNYPNPFNPSTTIGYKVKSYQVIKLVVYDILGKKVATLVNEKQSPGTYEVKFPNVQSANIQLPSGVYFYTLFADGNLVETRKMVLIK
jgi:photosystem II stability/assembly factor-like uncharacterized protein